MGYTEFERLCKAKGVTPYFVAKETGVSTSTLSSWKAGRYVPKKEKMQKLADFFTVSVDYLLTGKEPTEAKTGWYLDEETARVAQEVFENPETRLLFDAARDARPEDIRLAAEMLKRMKETNPDG